MEVNEGKSLIDDDEKLKETILTSGQRLKGSKQYLHPWWKSRSLVLNRKRFQNFTSIFLTNLTTIKRSLMT